MTDIDLKGLPDHDLLVLAVSHLNDMMAQLETVCTDVRKQRTELTVLQTEHQMRVAQSEPCSTAGKTTEQKGIIATLVIAITALAAALIEIIRG